MRSGIVIPRRVISAATPIISSSDNVRAVGEQLLPYIEQDYYVLGTDGMGRSEAREALQQALQIDPNSTDANTLMETVRQQLRLEQSRQDQVDSVINGTGLVPVTVAGWSRAWAPRAPSRARGPATPWRRWWRRCCAPTSASACAP